MSFASNRSQSCKAQQNPSTWHRPSTSGRLVKLAHIIQIRSLQYALTNSRYAKLPAAPTHSAPELHMLRILNCMVRDKDGVPSKNGVKHQFNDEDCAHYPPRIFQVVLTICAVSQHGRQL